MLRTFRNTSSTNSIARGPKKAANAAAALKPAILVLRTTDTEPTIKDLEEYPAWLTSLMQPQLKMKHKIALMQIEDNLAFMPDADDLKTLLKQHKKKKYTQKKSAYSQRSKGLFAEEFWEGETDELPVWYSEENVLQRQIEMQLKAKDESDEVVVEEFDTKKFTTNDQLEKIYSNED